MEYSPVLFQHRLEMGRMGCEVTWTGGEAAGERGTEREAFLPVWMSSGLCVQGKQGRSWWVWRYKNRDFKQEQPVCVKQK